MSSVAAFRETRLNVPSSTYL